MSEGTLRDRFFGDLPIRWWAGSASDTPWMLFRHAAGAIDAKRDTDAVALLQLILSTPGLESRHYAQAWHALRQLGEQPDAEHAKQILGVVIDVHLDEGLDTLACYADRTARYFNWSGRATIWERPGPQLDASINDVIAEARLLVQKIGPWDKQRPPPPARGDVQLHLLTPSGLHFGRASMAVMQADPIGGPLFMASVRLLQAITQLS